MTMGIERNNTLETPLAYLHVMDNLQALPNEAEDAEYLSDIHHFFRSQKVAMHELTKVSDRHLGTHVHCMAEILGEICDANLLKFNDKSIRNMLRESLFADVRHFLTNVDYKLRFNGDAIDSSLDRSIEHFPHKIAKSLHIWSVHGSLTKLSRDFENIFPAFCYRNSLLSKRNVKLIWNLTETVRAVLQKQLQKTQVLYDSERFPLRNGLSEYLTEFLESAKRSCARCQQPLGCESDFTIFDTCQHLYCHGCYSVICVDDFDTCPTCKKRINMWTTSKVLNDVYSQDESLLRYTELRDVARGLTKRKAEKPKEDETEAVARGSGSNSDHPQLGPPLEDHGEQAQLDYPLQEPGQQAQLEHPIKDNEEQAQLGCSIQDNGEQAQLGYPLKDPEQQAQLGYPLEEDSELEIHILQKKDNEEQAQLGYLLQDYGEQAQLSYQLEESGGQVQLVFPLEEDKEVVIHVLQMDDNEEQALLGDQL